jgi:hypothetical protein
VAYSLLGNSSNGNASLKESVASGLPLVPTKYLYRSVTHAISGAVSSDAGLPGTDGVALESILLVVQPV